MKSKLLVMLLLAGCFLLMNPFLSNAQINNWTDVVDQEVFNWGEADEWDDGQVWNPAVIKDGDTLRMYYTGGDENVWESPITSIGYAWSLDGIEWIRHPSNPVLVPNTGWSLFGCAVIKDENTYKMWYGRASSPEAPNITIAYATSDDGINWTKQESFVLSVGPSNEWDNGIITPQTVIKEDDVFKMWYWAGKTGFPFEESMPQTGMATSSDGIEWTKYDDPATTEAPYASSDPVLKVGGSDTWDEHRAICPMVRKKAWGYEMWYVGATWNDSYHDIGYAHSNDGIHWTKHPNPVYMSPSWGDTNYGGTVLAFDNEYHLWFALFHSNGIPNQAKPRIGYAKSPNPAGIVLQNMETNIQLYPNPFTISTTLSYELEQPSTVRFCVFNQLGQLIYHHAEDQQQGEQHMQWNGSKHADGLYFYRLEAGDQVATGKIVKAK